MKRSAKIAFTLLFPFVTHHVAATENPHTEGFWKYRIPERLQGEFNSLDPMGLIAGVKVKANCSIRWMSEQGKLYCFSSVTSLSFFLDSPKTNIRKARMQFIHSVKKNSG